MKSSGSVYRKWDEATPAILWSPSDPLAPLDDDFSSGVSLTANAWLIEDSNPSCSPSDTLVGAEADLTISGGSATGSLWLDANDGALWYREITGPCDMRARVRVRNASDTGLPAVLNLRTAGIAVHDPNRAAMNHLSVAVGTSMAAVHQEEWATTDASLTLAALGNATLTSGELLYDLRIVRRSSDDQVFDLMLRSGTALALEDDAGWTTLQAVDRSDNTSPVRASAVPMPDVCRWGFFVSAALALHDIRMFVDSCLFRSTNA